MPSTKNETVQQSYSLGNNCLRKTSKSHEHMTAGGIVHVMVATVGKQKNVNNMNMICIHGSKIL